VPAEWRNKAERRVWVVRRPREGWWARAALREKSRPVLPISSLHARGPILSSVTSVAILVTTESPLNSVGRQKVTRSSTPRRLAGFLGRC